MPNDDWLWVLLVLSADESSMTLALVMKPYYNIDGSPFDRQAGVTYSINNHVRLSPDLCRPYFQGEVRCVANLAS